MIADKNCFACSTDEKPVSWIVIGVVVDASDLFMYFVISGSDGRLRDGDYTQLPPTPGDAHAWPCPIRSLLGHVACRYAHACAAEPTHQAS
jgi:hypothetical protein